MVGTSWVDAMFIRDDLPKLKGEDDILILFHPLNLKCTLILKLQEYVQERLEKELN